MMLTPRTRAGWLRRAGWGPMALLCVALAACNDAPPTPATPTAAQTPPPPVTATVPAGPTATAAPPTATAEPTPVPTSTPDTALLPEAYTGPDELFSLRHPSEWTTEDLSDEAEVLVRFQPSEESNTGFVVNLINTGNEVTEAQLPLLIESYLDNFFQGQRDQVELTREPLDDGGERVVALGPGDDPAQQLHLEFRFGRSGPLFTTLIGLATEAEWTELSPAMSAMAESFALSADEASALPTPAAAEDQAPVEGVTVVNSSTFTATTGSLYVVGEVDNSSANSYEEAQVTVRLVDGEGSTLATEAWNTRQTLLPAGERSPFVAIFDTVPPGWEEVETTVTARPAEFYQDYLYPDLSIVDDTAGTPTFGAYRISGRVVNLGEGSARAVEIIGTLYAEDGTVLGVESTAVETPMLAPGDSMPFELVFFAKADGDVADYRVSAQAVRVVETP